MHKALVTAVLVASLGLIADMRPLVAQGAAWDTLAQSRKQSADEVRTAKTATRRGGHADTKRRVSHRLPNQRKIAERNGYKQVSDLVNFPKFFPGLGIIFVKPETLPLGPFLCFDRKDRLVATVYMVPVKDIDDHKLQAAPALARRVDHVSFHFNAGHPGVDVPHYHFVMWHVTKNEEARVAK